jgi:hypothetical protein
MYLLPMARLPVELETVACVALMHSNCGSEIKINRETIVPALNLMCGAATPGLKVTVQDGISLSMSKK